MPKKIKWIGSLSHEVRGVVKLRYGEVAILEDDVVKQLPRSGYELLRNIPPTEGNKSETAEIEENFEAGFTNAQNTFYKEHTLQQILKLAGESGIEVPSFLKRKSEVFQYILDNGFQVGE